MVSRSKDPDMRKILKIIVIVVLVGACIYLGLAVAASRGCGCIETGDQPDITPPYKAVLTPSKTYFTYDVLESPEGVTIKGYFVKLDGKWIYRDGEIFLNREAYGEIKVVEVSE